MLCVVNEDDLRSLLSHVGSEKHVIYEIIIFLLFFVITEKLTCKLICSGFWLSWTLAPEFSMICFIVAPALPMISPAVVFGTIILTLKLNLVSDISTLTIVNRSGCPWDVTLQILLQIFFKHLVLFKRFYTMIRRTEVLAGMDNGLWVPGLGTHFWKARNLDKNTVPDCTHGTYFDLFGPVRHGISSRTHLAEHISKNMDISEDRSNEGINSFRIFHGYNQSLRGKSGFG